MGPRVIEVRAWIARWGRRFSEIVGTEELRAFAQRSREALLVAAVTGAVTGVGVALFDRAVVDGLLDRIFDLSPWILAGAPLCGLALAAAALRWLCRDPSSSSADLYLEAFHDARKPLVLRDVPGRMLAAIATLGFGGAMGLEGPSLYLGASLGTVLHERFKRLSRIADRRVLLVAGAAAGVAAIFKAPATGAVF